MLREPNLTGGIGVEIVSSIPESLSKNAILDPHMISVMTAKI